jgi:CheY-like chemotaxis protein/HPt (histidine-containing phosphotransfer) domain-containing protein
MGAAQQLTRAASRPPGELRRLTGSVLLAEDNGTNQQVALELLRKLGLRADAVADGREAIEALRRIPYDLVLMDIQMPEMDGLEATRVIRATKAGTLNPSVPIVAMTAHAMQGHREECLAAGMDDYLSKPIRFATLSEVLAKWLPALDAGEATELARPSSQHASGPDKGRDPAVFREEVLLDVLMGDRPLARTIASGFLQDIPSQIEALRRHMDAGDTTATERQSHSIKGAAAAVGAEALVRLASQLEQAGKAGAIETVRGAFQQLQSQFDHLRRAMEASSLLDPRNP